MSTTTAPSLAASIDQLATTAGLELLATEPSQDFTGNPTTRFAFALPADPARNQSLELSDSFDIADPRFSAELTTYLAEAARRLRNPRPDCYLSLLGLPLSFSNFVWPFHQSTSGADTFIVHGEIRLETGEAATLMAKISAALTQTFAEVVAALEQPFAESFIYNAIRKTMDQGQLELVKSGNRQPVPVTTRFYSAKRNLFIFNDTTAEQRKDFLAAKVFWLSGVLGASAPLWIADPRDAQYLNTTVDELKATAAALAADGLLTLTSDDDAVPTSQLMARRAQYEVEVEEGLNFIKPHFNEDMRSGNTNM